jgi:hypothetical protein
MKLRWTRFWYYVIGICKICWCEDGCIISCSYDLMGLFVRGSEEVKQVCKKHPCLPVASLHQTTDFTPGYMARGSNQGILVYQGHETSLHGGMLRVCWKSHWMPFSAWHESDLGSIVRFLVCFWQNVRWGILHIPVATLHIRRLLRKYSLTP